MRFAVATIVGITILTFALYVQAARDLNREFILFMNVDRVGHDGATHHRPLIVARASASDMNADLLANLFADKSTTASLDSLAQAISSGAAWSLSGSDVSIRIDLRQVEAALIEQLIATDDKTERERLLEAIRAIRSLRNNSERAANVSSSRVANDDTPKPLTAATVQRRPASSQTDKSVAGHTEGGVAGMASATEANSTLSDWRRSLAV